MRQALGLAVFSGMLGVTFFGIFLTPVFFYTLQRFGERKEATAHAAPPAEPPPGSPAFHPKGEAAPPSAGLPEPRPPAGDTEPPGKHQG